MGAQREIKLASLYTGLKHMNEKKLQLCSTNFCIVITTDHSTAMRGSDGPHLWHNN